MSAQEYKCHECKKSIQLGKQFEVLGKIMCSTKCCKIYRDKEDAKKPKSNDTLYSKPDFGFGCGSY